MALVSFKKGTRAKINAEPIEEGAILVPKNESSILLDVDPTTRKEIKSGHDIQDASNTPYTKRDVLRFVDATPADDSADAQTTITIHREMTQAQFDALTDAQKYGSIVITDAEEAVAGADNIAYGSGTVGDALDSTFFLMNKSLSFSNNTATITDARITADTFVFVNVTDASQSAAANAGFTATNSSGKVTFTVTSTPSASIVVNIMCVNAY